MQTQNKRRRARATNQQQRASRRKANNIINVIRLADSIKALISFIWVRRRRITRLRPIGCARRLPPVVAEARLNDGSGSGSKSGHIGAMQRLRAMQPMCSNCAQTNNVGGGGDGGGTSCNGASRILHPLLLFLLSLLVLVGFERNPLSSVAFGARLIATGPLPLA